MFFQVTAKPLTRATVLSATSPIRLAIVPSARSTSKACVAFWPGRKPGAYIPLNLCQFTKPGQRLQTGPLTILQLHSDEMNFPAADVFNRVRRQGWGPGCASRGRCGAAAGIDQHVPLIVTADKMAPTQDVVNAAPAVGVDRNGMSCRDARIKDANMFVFHEELVVRAGSAQRIQMIRPILPHNHPPVPSSGRKPMSFATFPRHG